MTRLPRLQRSSNDLSSAAHMLDSAAGHMVTGVEEAAMQANSVAAASEEMSKTTSEIAHNCVVAAKSSEKANGSASSGAVQNIKKDMPCVHNLFC